MSADGSVADLLSRHVRDVPDFPTPGVVFKDIAPLLADGPAFAAVIADLADRYRGRVDAVVGIEARGFVLAAPVAVALGVGFVPVRKAGKLPGPVWGAEYDLEYGSATIEVQQDAFGSGRRVLVLDDVLATGGTAEATCELVERAGAEVVEVAVLMELSFLRGRDRLPGRTLHPLLTI
ncbi:adenine phosphoribosyltransferase [Angustibacter sp. McL0619]|uniref:adenine phosphoribosyltransferase n=1 Tax=Angustibacter sp. McL0619 TaxID=3415676 RepID=UPI003CE9C33B